MSWSASRKPRHIPRESREREYRHSDFIKALEPAARQQGACLARTKVWSAIEHVSAAMDALAGENDPRAQNVLQVLEHALDQLVEHKDAPAVFTWTTGEVTIPILVDEQPASRQ